MNQEEELKQGYKEKDEGQVSMQQSTTMQEEQSAGGFQPQEEVEQITEQFDQSMSIGSQVKSSPVGQHDETCIDESPEAKAKSKHLAGQQNKKAQALSKFTNPINSTKKLRGVSTGGMNLTPVRSGNRGHQVFTPEESQKISNAIVMQINMLAGQLFELLNNLNKVILYKPRRVYKFLSREY